MQIAQKQLLLLNVQNKNHLRVSTIYATDKDLIKPCVFGKSNLKMLVAIIMIVVYGAALQDAAASIPANRFKNF